MTLKDLKEKLQNDPYRSITLTIACLALLALLAYANGGKPLI